MKKVFLLLAILLMINISSNALASHQYGNPYGNSSNSPHVTDSNGNYKGNLNDNPYDPNSVSNQYGRYGSQYSQDSINNKYRNW